MSFAILISFAICRRTGGAVLAVGIALVHTLVGAVTLRSRHFPNANSFVPVRTKSWPCQMATLERWRVPSPSSLKFAVWSSLNSLPSDYSVCSVNDLAAQDAEFADGVISPIGHDHVFEDLHLQDQTSLSDPKPGGMKSRFSSPGFAEKIHWARDAGD